MQVRNLGEIEAVAFDIDGTLYLQWRLHLRMLFHFIRHSIFFLRYGIVRGEMHRMDRLENFCQVQAQLMAKYMHCSEEQAQRMLDRIVYDGLKRHFTKIPPCANVQDTFWKFKEAGFKIAILSDFPPEQKGELWGLKKYCSVILGTEELGALKPSPYSFRVMAEKLGVAPEHVLYVGNSIKYDVKGAKNAGMKCAYFEPLWRHLFHMPLREADISFGTYRQLQNIVLQ